jgi:uncharacterized protein (DUF362 family)
VTAHPHIYLDRLGVDYLPSIQAGLEWVNLRSKLKWGDAVFVKPNLTYPIFRRGVMTNPECVEAVVVALKDYTNQIIVGEADSGGYNPFNIDEVLAKTGIKQLEQKYGIRVCNLSHLPYRSIEFPYKRQTLRVPLPTLLLDETDLLLTIPVPKIHMNTQVSLAIKNQWGCIPEPSMRLRLHPFLEKVVYEVNKHIRASFAVVDGKYGLNRSGPMRGDVVELNWLMVADNIYAAEVACCHLMRIDPRCVYYLRYLATTEKVLPEMAEIEFNQEWHPFVKEQFYLHRAWTDYPGLWAFRSPLLTYLGYYSPIANVLHKLLYLFREPFYDYGEAGRPAYAPSSPSDGESHQLPTTEAGGGETGAKEAGAPERPVRA